MNNDSPNKKQFLGGSRNRLKVFIVGLIVLLGAGGFAIYSQTELAKWKETPIVSTTVGSPCSNGRSNAGTNNVFTYDVDGVSYTYTSCISTRSVAKTISYNPSNPSQALFNTIAVYQYMAIGLTVLGVVVLLGSIFASDTKKTDQLVK